LIKFKIKELPEFESSSNYFNSNDINIFDYIPCSKIYFDIKDKNENKNNIQPKIYYQKSNLNPKENAYIVNIKNNIKNDKLNPALFIFLIDQSYSMEYTHYGWNINEGEENENIYPIKIVSKALELFLQSLPANSYYQLIGFGSNFKKYDENPKEYTKENIQKSLEIIKSLNADLGGTNIYSPLKSIYGNEKEYDKIKLPKNIFLLTDGEINDKDLIKNAGIMGKGGFNFCPNLDGLNEIIVNEINKAISSYILDFKMNCSLDNISKYKIIDIPEAIRYNEIINVGYIAENKYKKINVETEYFDEKNIKNKYNIIPMEIENGEELSKIIINKYLYNQSNDKETEDLSLKYQVLTKNTALFAEIELSDKISDEMKIEILGNQNNNNIRDFPYNNDFGILDNNNIIREGCIGNSYENLSQIKYKRKENANFDNIVGVGNYYLSTKKKKEFSFPFNIFNCCKNVDKVIQKDKIYEIETEKSTNENNNNSPKLNLKNKDDIMKIINTQDFIEGYWEINEQTKYIKEKYLDKFNKIKSKIDLNDKIIITILIIFFIENECNEFLNELNIIIKKAKLYIQKNAKKSYEEIISLV